MHRVRPALALLLGCALLGSCGLLRSATDATAGLAGAVIPGSSKPPPSPEELLADVMRYADQSLQQFDQATRTFESTVGTPEARITAARWRVSAGRIVPPFATSPSSLTGLLDLTFTATVAGWLIDDHFEDQWGAAVQPIRIVVKRSEESGWSLIGRHIDAAKVAEAREVLNLWRAENPRISFEVLAEFPGFVSLAQKRGRDPSTGLLGMVGLDPLGGLEPVAREIMQIRLLGQRALFFAQHLTRIVTAETELALLELRDTPETTELRADLERTTTSLESFAATAAGLPAAVKAEREAAVAQISTELTAQRAGLISDLSTAEEPVRKILVEARASLEATERAAGALTGTVQALDAWLGGFSKDEEPAAAGAQAPTAPAEPAAPGKPFDITEYGTSAEQIGAAARELTALVAELDQSLPELQRLVGETTTRAEESLDHAALRALEVGLALIAAAAVAAWLVRRRKAPGVPG